MTSLIPRVDAWCRAGDLTPRDLAIFRIAFASFVLLSFEPMGRFTSMAGAFDPPPGPMALFPALPSARFLDALGYAVIVSAAFLLVGLWTRAASASVAVTVMLAVGFDDSFGKIGHQYQWLFIVPAVMAFSSWGMALSADSRRASGADAEESPQWPMRLLALMLGLAFLTAGYAKLRGGWLDLDTHATQGYLLRTYIVRGKQEMLAPYVAGVNSGAFWEALDWLTVILELGLVFAALSWRTFRIAVALATQFHLGIMLMMNIAYAGNVVAYGAFVRWQRLLGRPRDAHGIPRWAALGAALAVAAAVSLWKLDHEIPLFTIRQSIVAAGALIGAGYLVWLVSGPLRHRADGD